MNGLTSFLKTQSATRLALIIGVTAGVAIALALIMARAGGQSEALVYAGMSMQDASRAAQALDAAGIEYRLGDGGGSIYVSREEVANARLMLADEGALGSGTVGYEIFDETDALGTTQFIQNVNARRATEGELARTIATIEGIENARVHLVLPERRLFERESQVPTATVVIGLNDPTQGAQSARTIRNLVATAVPGLAPGRVTVVDESGRTLANGAESAGDFEGVMMDERRSSLEARLRDKALDAIEPIVGPGAARVQVAANLDMDRVTQNSEIFDPSGQVVRSTVVAEEVSQDSESEAGEGVTVANNLPEPAAPAAEGPESTSSSSTERTEETTNYEISSTTTTEVQEAGEIERLSVAVAVDQRRVVAGDGTVTYEPRPQEELDRIAALVRAAVGFNEERGDVIEVTSLPFQHPDLTLGTSSEGGFSFGKNDIMRIAEIAVMLVMGLALILLVARPLAKGLTNPLPALAGAGGGGQAQIGEAAAKPQLTDQSAKSLPKPDEAKSDSNIPDADSMDGKLKDSSVKRMTEIVEAHPEESLSILRAWMSES